MGQRIADSAHLEQGLDQHPPAEDLDPGRAAAQRGFGVPHRCRQSEYQHADPVRPGLRLPLTFSGTDQFQLVLRPEIRHERVVAGGGLATQLQFHPQRIQRLHLL